MKSVILTGIMFLVCAPIGCSINATSEHKYDGVTKVDKTLEIAQRIKSDRDDLLTISPGIRVGDVYLGDTYTQIQMTKGVPARENDYSFGGCNFRIANWIIDKSNKNSDLLEVTFNSHDIAVRLKTGARNSSTPEGIASNDELASIKTKYLANDTIEAFLDLGLRSTTNRFITGWPVYWVDQSKGIAFEFVKVIKDNKWRVNSISIFNPNHQFHRSYCKVEDTWIRLNSIELNDAEISEHYADQN